MADNCSAQCDLHVYKAVTFCARRWNLSFFLFEIGTYTPPPIYGSNNLVVFKKQAICPVDVCCKAQ